MKSYIHTDTEPHNGINLYRLKIVDQEYNTNYSKVSRVDFNSNNKISVYPNPAINEISIKDPTKKMNIINVYDAIGNRVVSVNVSGTDFYKLDLKNIQSGIYIMNIINDDGTNYNNTFIKK